MTLGSGIAIAAIALAIAAYKIAALHYQYLRQRDNKGPPG